MTTAVLSISSTLATAQSGDDATAPLQDPQTVTDEVETAPYVVFAAKADAHVRSGPGDEHYRTDPVRRGQELEVYVETADGWLGIRPPEKSFCWIPANSTDWQEGDSVAAITEDETIAWIGTRLGSARRYRWQVQLEHGESVNVVGSAERSGKPWLRITPPSGEFRWIHTDDVADNAEQLLEIVQAESSSAVDEQVDGSDDLVPRAMTAVSVSGDTQNKRDLASEPFAESGPSIVQAGSVNEPDEALGSKSSSRRGSGTATLTEVTSAPKFAAAPAFSSTVDERIPDKAFQFHRGADVNDFADRGAVIGSGLREDLFPESPKAVNESLTTQGDDAQSLSTRSAEAASSAANAIVAPIRKVTDVVANFISPPRVVEINGSRIQLAPANSGFNNGSTERPWIAGSNTPNTMRSPLGSPVASSSAVDSSTRVAQVSFQSSKPSIRIVPLSDISKVEDAVSGANATDLQRILSRLMADAASAREIDPLLRRAQTLLNSGDVNSTTHTRKLIETAQQYRSVAIRRDGTTRIDTSIASVPAPAFEQNTAQQSGMANDPGVMPNPAIQSAVLPVTSTVKSPSAQSPPAQRFEEQAKAVTQEISAGTAIGTLVRVYSSRPNMPPYVLTDDTGLTVAYVTPYPGVNLATHLNSRVAVRGNEKLLQGMAMPHIMVDAVKRR